MFSTCLNQCGSVINAPSGVICESEQRSEVPVRFIYAKCDFTFPAGVFDTPVLASAFLSAIGALNVGVTPMLADVKWEDPVTQTQRYNPICFPPSTIVTQRVLTAKDYNTFNVDSMGSSAPFHDRELYKLFQNKALALRGYITCDGKIYLFLNKNGTFCRYTAHYFTGYDANIDGKLIEYKNYQITFDSDPVIWDTPYLDIVASNSMSTLGYLFQ